MSSTGEVIEGPNSAFGTNSTPAFHDPTYEEEGLARDAYQAGFFQPNEKDTPTLQLPPPATCDPRCFHEGGNMFDICAQTNCMPCDKCIDYLAGHRYSLKCIRSTRKGH